VQLPLPADIGLTICLEKIFIHVSQEENMKMPFKKIKSIKKSYDELRKNGIRKF
jgi:hypothetical protein